MENGQNQTPETTRDKVDLNPGTGAEATPLHEHDVEQVKILDMIDVAQAHRADLLNAFKAGEITGSKFAEDVGIVDRRITFLDSLLPTVKQIDEAQGHQGDLLKDFDAGELSELGYVAKANDTQHEINTKSREVRDALEQYEDTGGDAKSKRGIAGAALNRLRRHL